jgi:imidazole glycerol phosphate synthase glutamine amidotransferase subunit
MIGVINYGAGNLGSVMNALGRLGASACFVKDPEDMRSYGKFEKIIFPGDGHFAMAMDSLEKSGYDQAIREWIQADKPFLGVCIGLQLLFDASEEAQSAVGKETRGLSIIPGAVRRFPGRKIPQIGWNSTRMNPASKFFKGLPNDTFFYYIHSFYAEPADKNVIAATAEYYLPYCSAVERGALFAAQFHPEKSGAAGLKLLENWLEN